MRRQGCARDACRHSVDALLEAEDEADAQPVEVGSYAWVKSRPYGHNALVEANVRFLADRDFQAKGLSLMADKPALLAWVGYEPDSYYYGGGSDLRVLDAKPRARRRQGAGLAGGRARGAIRTVWQVKP